MFTIDTDSNEFDLASLRNDSAIIAQTSQAIDYGFSIPSSNEDDDDDFTNDDSDLPYEKVEDATYTPSKYVGLHPNHYGHGRSVLSYARDNRGLGCFA